MTKLRSRSQCNVPTIADVARHAGISPMTVSRVINGESTVRPAMDLYRFCAGYLSD